MTIPIINRLTKHPQNILAIQTIEYIEKNWRKLDVSKCEVETQEEECCSIKLFFNLKEGTK